MEKPGDRLKRAIELRGHADVADFARKLSMAPGTVRQHINRQSIPKDAAARYGKRLHVPVAWLLYGQGPDPFADPANFTHRDDAAVNDQVRDSDEEYPVPGDSAGPGSEGGDFVRDYTFTRIVGDLREEIGELKNELKNLKARIEGTDQQSPPQSGRQQSS